MEDKRLLYNVIVAPLDDGSPYNENLSFIGEPNNEQITDWIRFIRPHRRYSERAIAWNFIKDLES